MPAVWGYARVSREDQALALQLDALEAALTLWMRLTDKVVHIGSPSPELIAAAVLAGPAAGIRPQGFDVPDMVKPADVEEG